jgi:HD superfamily phosphohydrolase
MHKNIYHAIKDPVHGTMQFTTLENNWLKPIIDSPNFQRLRHIKQLGMGDFIFPGAVHTRFNHCLGCSYISSQIAHKVGLAEEECQLVMIACLLHDIGHGPFSHTFEDLFPNKLLRHEAWTPFFLAEYRTKDFFSAYNRQNPRHHLTEEKFKLIEAMIMHKSPVKRLLADIVSSQLDADRLDYLLRDSHFCGVAYGQFDLHWMLNSMVIVNSPQGERLGLTHKGIGVVEHYLMARRLMTRNIYLHQKKLALEFFLIKLLSSLAESMDDYPPYAAIKKTRLGIFLAHANQFNQGLHFTADLEQYRQHFLTQNYVIYKELCDYDVSAVVKLLAQMDNEQHPAAQIAKRLHYRQMPKIIRIDAIDVERVKQQVAEVKAAHPAQIQDWQLALRQIPHQSYTVEEDPILIVNEHNLVRPLNEMSLMIEAIGNKFEHTAFLCIDKIIYAHSSVQQLIKNLA